MKKSYLALLCAGMSSLLNAAAPSVPSAILMVEVRLDEQLISKPCMFLEDKHPACLELENGEGHMTFNVLMQDNNVHVHLMIDFAGSGPQEIGEYDVEVGKNILIQFGTDATIAISVVPQEQPVNSQEEFEHVVSEIVQ